MYNMIITLFGFNLDLEILILIGIVYLILVAHTVGGCCNMPRIMEGLKSMNSSNSNSSNSNNSNSDNSNSDNIKKMAMLKNIQQQQQQ